MYIPYWASVTTRTNVQQVTYSEVEERGSQLKSWKFYSLVVSRRFPSVMSQQNCSFLTKWYHVDCWTWGFAMHQNCNRSNLLIIYFAFGWPLAFGQNKKKCTSWKHCHWTQDPRNSLGNVIHPENKNKLLIFALSFKSWPSHVVMLFLKHTLQHL